MQIGCDEGQRIGASRCDGVYCRLLEHLAFVVGDYGKCGDALGKSVEG